MLDIKVDPQMERVLSMVFTEFHVSEARFGKMKSEHEGYALIKEELEELWEEVKCHGSHEAKTMEAIQVAAMALHFILDLVPPTSASFLENILDIKIRENPGLNHAIK